MNKLILLSILVLGGCASDPYFTREGTKVSRIQDYDMPADATIYFHKRTAKQARAQCAKDTYMPTTMACVYPPAKGSNVWVIYAPNKKTALHEFEHIIFGPEHATTVLNAKWMRDEKAKAAWRKRIAEAKALEQKRLEIAKGDD